jgi:glycosyltransferase involved in cell wall biosynthesis
MISVAMCTYNGASYILEQLESISNQIVPVDELVVCDDGSKDNTIGIIKDFAAKSKFPVYIHQNEKNLGSTKNFEKCLSLCQGEIIFFTDQDDVWRADKVEKHMAYYQTHPQVNALFSDALMIDDDSLSLNKSIWQEIEFDEFLQKEWNEGRGYKTLFKSFVVTGATLSIRKSCLNELLPFPTHIPELIHDGWIALILNLRDQIYFIPETLVSYRIHRGQQVGFGGKARFVTLKERMTRDRHEKLKPLIERSEYLSDLYAQLSITPNIPAQKLKELHSICSHFKSRCNLPDLRLFRLPRVAYETFKGRYLYSSKDWWLPALGDLIE